ncbi:uncharacterized protein LOC143913829 [Arctopsyche grandis]|uniref:uncharacterized protein LOC143913829 n=1 Tax=Arctopsyche grandis TaxID=121162 RepID=UPI00406D8B1B
MCSWQTEFLIEFIDLLRENEPLWKVKCKDYYNRLKKKKSYEILVAKVKEVKPDATKDDVAKKINNLRSSMRKEFKKVKLSMKSETNEVYQPKLWYYDNLKFLLDQDDSIEKDAEDSQVTQDYTQDASMASSSASEMCDDEPLNVFKKRRKHTKMSIDESVLNKINKHLGNIKASDSFDIFGQHVACKLRMLPHFQKIFCEKVINDTLFMAQLGKLTVDAKIVHGGTSNSAPSAENQ